MNNKKGFTLVELMGILVILGVILIVAVPTITKTLKNSSANEEVEFLNTACAAAKTYLTIEKESYNDFWNRSTGVSINASIKIEDLKNEGYLDDNLNNPTTKTKIQVTRYISTDANISCELAN